MKILKRFRDVTLSAWKQQKKNWCETKNCLNGSLKSSLKSKFSAKESNRQVMKAVIIVEMCTKIFYWTAGPSEWSKIYKDSVCHQNSEAGQTFVMWFHISEFVGLPPPDDNHKWRVIRKARPLFLWTFGAATHISLRSDRHEACKYFRDIDGRLYWISTSFLSLYFCNMYIYFIVVCI